MFCALEKPVKNYPLKRLTLKREDLHEKKLLLSNIRIFFNLTSKVRGKGEEYKSVESTVNYMKVVNNIAKRGVALTNKTNFSRSMKKNSFCC